MSLFDDTVPDFKKYGPGKMIPTPREPVTLPDTTPPVDIDDVSSMFPTFIPVAIPVDKAHEIATDAADTFMCHLEKTPMCNFQADALHRGVYDRVQQLLMAQSSWNWQSEYEIAIGRGEIPDPRCEND